jgi:hypothetical protein
MKMKSRYFTSHLIRPYSPELNPDEYLNRGLKARVHSGQPARSEAQLTRKGISHLRMLQKRSHRVAKYAEHEKIRYAG